MAVSLPYQYHLAFNTWILLIRISQWSNLRRVWYLWEAKFDSLLGFIGLLIQSLHVECIGCIQSEAGLLCPPRGPNICCSNNPPRNEVRIASCSWPCRGLHHTWWLVGVVCLMNFVWHLLMASDQLVELLPPWKIAVELEKWLLPSMHTSRICLCRHMWGSTTRCWKFAFEPVDPVSGWRLVVNKPNSMFQFCDVHHLVLGKHLSRLDYIMMWMIKTMCILVRYETCFFIGYDNITSLPSSCPSEHDVPTSGVVGKIWTRIITQRGHNL